jgi:hypothetical protein
MEGDAFGAAGFRVVLLRGFFRGARVGLGLFAVGFLGMLCPSCCELTTTPPTRR